MSKTFLGLEWTYAGRSGWPGFAIRRYLTVASCLSGGFLPRTLLTALLFAPYFFASTHVWLGSTCRKGLSLATKGEVFFFLPQRPILLPCGHFCLRSFDFCLPRGIHLPSLHHELINRLLCISHVHSPHRHLGGRDTDSFCMSFTLSFSSCSWSLMAAFLAWFHFELSTDSWSLVTATTASNGRLWID